MLSLAGREADIVALVARARERHGPIDLFCSNAGIPTGVGLESGAAADLAPEAMAVEVAAPCEIVSAGSATVRRDGGELAVY